MATTTALSCFFISGACYYVLRGWGKEINVDKLEIVKEKIHEYVIWIKCMLAIDISKI